MISLQKKVAEELIKSGKRGITITETAGRLGTSTSTASKWLWRLAYSGKAETMRIGSVLIFYSTKGGINKD